MIDLIVFGGSVIVTGLFLLLACWLTNDRHEKWAERYWAELQPPATDEPAEWTGPLHSGSTGAEKRMRRYFAEHGQILRKRASDRTRKVAAVLDARRPRRFSRADAVATVHQPRAAAPLEPLPAPVVAAEHATGEPAVPVDERLYTWKTGEFAKSMLDELLATYMPDGQR